jgi:hypothetical protein
MSSTFYEQLLGQFFCAKKLQSQNVTRKKLRKALSYEKFLLKMLMKLQSISSTFYKQLLHRYAFAKKFQKPNCN